MAFRAEVMKNRGVENFYRLLSVDPAQVGALLLATGGLRSPSRLLRPTPPPRCPGFLEIAGVPCLRRGGVRGRRAGRFPLRRSEDVDLLLK